MDQEAQPAKAPTVTDPALSAKARPHGAAELAEGGRKLREAVPRQSHGAWKKRTSTNIDPLEILKATDADRLPELVGIRYGRMLQSPFAFYRGAAAVMAADLDTTPASGPLVQACGDCHLANFGGFATPERDIIFDINDFDETLPAPWEWDIKRLAASIILAGRSCNLGNSASRDAAEATVRSYRKRLAQLAETHPLDIWYMKMRADEFIDMVSNSERRALIRRNVDKARKTDGHDSDFPKLAGMVGGHIHIKDTPPLIYHPEEARQADFIPTLKSVLALYRETLAEDRRTLFDRYHLIDAAIKVVGVGSVGRRCWVALMMSASNDPLFLQVKEASASVLEPFAGQSVYPHHGQRVVMGQRLMQPASDIFLGWLTGPTGRQFYVRQLHDAKLKPAIESFDAEMLAIYGKACGRVLARAHAKSGDAATISGYLGAKDVFDKAVGDFAVAYADQAERDHAALKAAVRTGRITIVQEE